MGLPEWSRVPIPSLSVGRALLEKRAAYVKKFRRLTVKGPASADSPSGRNHGHFALQTQTGAE
jgi:hypothetical protein